MKKLFYCICFGVILSMCHIHAQFPSTLQVDSKGAIVVSPITKDSVLYRITIEGTYSMWPQFTDCHGVDGAYVYDVPQEELDAFRWPPKEVLGVPFVEIPHWVGDPQIYSFPPKQIATPMFEISFRKYKGLRIDGEPLPNSGYQSVTHRYQIEKMGTGKEFNLQIIDSNYNILQESVVPRYEDNCGYLKVTIEEIIPETDINICDIKPICKDGEYIGLQLWAAIFEEDTTATSGRKNILEEIDISQIGIVENGKFRCDIDSIVCGKSLKPISIGILIDRSGSMAAAISETDQTVRMDASKNAISNFVDNLKVEDSAFVMSFSDNITLNQEWTNNKEVLKNSVNDLIPSGKTMVYQAILDALDKVSTSSSPDRALVVLSDGANTTGTEWSDKVLETIQNYNIPVYIIALGLSTDPTDIEGRHKFGLIANASRGKVYDVYNANQLDSVYAKLSTDIAKDECCGIYFSIDPCPPGTERFIRLIYAPKDTIILSKVIKYVCDTCDVIQSIKENTPSNRIRMEIFPNPSDEQTNIKYHLQDNGVVKIEIFNIDGKRIIEIDRMYQEVGLYNYQVDTTNIQSGTYFVLVKQNASIVTKKVIIIH